MTGGKLSRAAGWILLGGIRFYQAVWSPLMPGACKFHPSCSRYAAEAIAVHGPRRGLVLALGRLWRCRPFTRGGIDPVPDKSRPAPVSPQLSSSPARLLRARSPSTAGGTHSGLAAPEREPQAHPLCEHQT